MKHETTKLHSLHYMKFLVACHWPLILTPTNAQIQLMNVFSKKKKFNIQHSSWPNRRSLNNKPKTWNYKTALTPLHEIFGRVSLAVDSHTNQCSNRINERYFQRTKNHGQPQNLAKGRDRPGFWHVVSGDSGTRQRDTYRNKFCYLLAK